MAVTLGMDPFPWRCWWTEWQHIDGQFVAEDGQTVAHAASGTNCILVYALCSSVEVYCGEWYSDGDQYIGKDKEGTDSGIIWARRKRITRSGQLCPDRGWTDLLYVAISLCLGPLVFVTGSPEYPKILWFSAFPILPFRSLERKMLLLSVIFV